MNRPRLLVILASLALLPATAGPAMAQQDAPDDDPFADDPGLFGEEPEEDPFAELEERANVGDDEANDSEGHSDETNETADEGDEEGNAIPLPFAAALASLLLAARLEVRRQG